MKKIKWRYLLKLLVFSFLFLLFIILLCLLYLYISYNSEIDKKIYSKGVNAIWVEHRWVDKKHTLEEYTNLADKLKQYQITDAFFHVGPLDNDGSISKEKYIYANDLLLNLKKTNSNIRIQAWIGQVEAKAGGILNIP